jgi:L-asparaginase II
MRDNRRFAFVRRAPLHELRLADHAPLAVATRGGIVESVHYGSVAVVDAAGRLVAAAGDPHATTFTRSALKPLQALPFVRDGGPRRFGYSAAQVALLCASHSGERTHVDAVADMLARAGNGVADLRCGTHAPGHYEVRGEVPPRPPYSPLAHNCSGKHAGMLAACSLHGHDKGAYLEFDHPVQRSIRAAVAEVAGVDEGALPVGIDGCSAPNYALPLAALAQAFAWLAAAGDAAACEIRDAMRGHPAMVSGTGRSDAMLMQAGRGDWIAKIGAEGVQAIGVASRRLGIAIKVADGSRRALYPAIVAVLDALGLLDDAQRDALSALAAPPIANVRGIVTGGTTSVLGLRVPPGPAARTTLR